MSEAKSSYQQILKATSLFGGVQFFSILISLVRSKIVAVLLGPSGIGILTLLNATLGLLSGFTGFGLELSGVKSISEVNSQDNPELIAKEAGILNRLCWITGFAGMLLTIVFSPWLSRLIFDSERYTIAVIWIAVALLFKQVTGSHLAVLQGLRRLKYLAEANLLGNLIGLIITIPLYYIWKEEAIAPSITIATVTGFLFAWFYASKLKLNNITFSNKDAFKEGKSLIRLGFMLSLSSFITLFSGYLLQLFINYRSGIEEVGFYNAGFAILNSYVGLIFTAMGTDYFPRLSAVSTNNEKVKEIVNQQAFVAVFLITPVIIFFLAFSPVIVRLLYSVKFYSIIPMLTWGILGMLFRAVSWSMGFILLAKGDSRIFIKTAVGFNAIQLILNVLGYVWLGLEGLGISFALYFFIHFVGMKAITGNYYSFQFEKDFIRLFSICASLCLITFFASFIVLDWLKYAVMGMMIIISVIFTFTELNKKVDLKEVFNKIRKKND
ncbi:oligosaccharide flippase family protein [Flavobacterium pedocola]